MPSPKKDNFQKEVAAHFNVKLPLVLYRKPFETAVNAVLQNKVNLNVLKDYNERGFVFAPFDFNGGEPILINPDRYFTYFPPKKTAVKVDSSFEINEDRAHHLGLVKKTIEEIKNGVFDKVVVSRNIELAANFPPLALFYRLINAYPSAFCYFFFHPEIGIWMGASPELLLSVKSLEFETTSLAGTVPVIGNNDPRWTKKELEEQQMVTLFIQNELKSLGIEVNVEQTKNVRAGKLWHLKSVLRGQLNSFNDLSLVLQGLHPTPAVCGLPKTRAKKYILENENYSREFYTGFLGALNLDYKSSAKFFVNLRCMKLDKGVAHIYVGGGITKDSIPEAEFTETVNKSKTILDLL